MIGIVESRADSASEHICRQLRDLLEWETLEDETQPEGDGGGRWYRTAEAELRRFEGMHLELESAAEAFQCELDLLVFASRHAGETGPLLTAHFTGNFGPGEYGGEDHALAEAAPNTLPILLEAFDEYAPEGYDVGLECTHHGPTDVGCPSLFVELGSSETEWADPAGARAVAQAILALRDVDAQRSRQVVGFGGGHYVPRFERIIRETPWTVGHVGADWPLEAMGDPEDHRDLLCRAFEASHAELAVIEGEKPAIERVITDLGYRVVSETWLRTVGDRPLELVEVVERELGPIADGVRFGTERSTPISVAPLPTDLLETVNGIDPEATWAAVESKTVAFETENGGTRVGKRVAVDADRSRLELVEALVPILEKKYESVTVTPESVVAHERAFAPELAREAGVKPGPAFGKLAEGEAVIVDGTVVQPESVTVDRTHRFQLADRD